MSNGYKQTPEHRMKLGDSKRGKRNHMYGKHHSQETRLKMSQSQKGKKRPPFSEEHRRKLSVARAGKSYPCSIETRMKLSKVNKHYRPTEEQKQRQRIAMAGRKASLETRKKMSQSRLRERNHRWTGGTSFLPYCTKFDKKRKEATRIFFKNCCILCGKTSDENIRGNKITKLPVHHIDHDKEQGCNGKPFNLVPLCHNCHAKEKNHRDEYSEYITKILESGFYWGIWDREQYKKEVMY